MADINAALPCVAFLQAPRPGRIISCTADPEIFEAIEMDDFGIITFCLVASSEGSSLHDGVHPCLWFAHPAD